MKDADLVIMDTMFEYNEYLQITWGHAYPEYAVKLANMAGVKQLMLFHHSPTSTTRRWTNSQTIGHHKMESASQK